MHIWQGNFHKKDEEIGCTPFYTAFKEIKEHPDNCFNIFLIFHKLGLYPRSSSRIEFMNSTNRRTYAFKYLQSPLKEWYRVPKTEYRVSYERKEVKEVKEVKEDKEETRILIRGLQQFR